MMRVLNVEDDPFKQNEIKSVLRGMGITDITLVECVDDAIKSVLESIDNNNPYNLIISDMQFPLFSDGKIDDRAGCKFFEELKRQNVNIPVIMCSSANLVKIPGTLGSVHYSKNTDLREEFRRLIADIK